MTGDCNFRRYLSRRLGHFLTGGFIIFISGLTIELSERNNRNYKSAVFDRNYIHSNDCAFLNFFQKSIEKFVIFHFLIVLISRKTKNEFPYFENRIKRLRSIYLIEKIKEATIHEPRWFFMEACAWCNQNQTPYFAGNRCTVDLIRSECQGGPSGYRRLHGVHGERNRHGDAGCTCNCHVSYVYIKSLIAN